MAWYELYLNENFDWGTDGSSDKFDLETIFLHELGHTLQVDHVGTLMEYTDQQTGEKDYGYFPEAVMNPTASKGLVQHELFPQDESAFCSAWTSWPN